MAVTDLSELAESIEAEVRDALRIPALDACRAIAREAGIRAARRNLAEAPDRIAAAQNAYREAQAAEAAARETHTQAVGEAEWTLSGEIKTEGNKRYRWVICECSVGTPECPGEPIPGCAVCNGDGKYRKFLLADEVKAWTAAEARKVPSVRDSERALLAAQERTAAARDELSVAERRFTAAKYDLQGAVAELTALSMGLASKETSR